MPLAGSLDIRTLLDGAPETTLACADERIDDVDILQLLYETAASDVEGLLPPALNPTIPPVISFLAYRAATSRFGPFSLVQMRLTARAGVRPRAFLVSARCDNEAVADALSRGWGYRISPADIDFHRYHDRVECGVTVDRSCILRIALVDPEPITGHDIQYAPGMHLARVEDEAHHGPRLVQVDSEYEFRRADRGRPVLDAFEPRAWGDHRLVPLQPVSASFTACDVTIGAVRYVCNPDLPAAEGTQHVGDT